MSYMYRRGLTELVMRCSVFRAGLPSSAISMACSKSLWCLHSPPIGCSISKASTSAKVCRACNASCPQILEGKMADEACCNEAQSNAARNMAFIESSAALAGLTATACLLTSHTPRPMQHDQQTRATSTAMTAAESDAELHHRSVSFNDLRV